ncbi:zinc dependent phospholipase C family protein [Paraflavitalea sp. CAU 1676]|uniref:zinc dependent phospholipase C family protein n=1 Tax=Paraflavitalea sp. CAU 1676 TaxID=3032598 RepID=UPI0023DB71E9|nr:zinc dependent phospholipase C family protein [Paraflavitalea sp. CAU 1676]MDF2190736.1 zinc dependent phospholipase C family protein [Paraflavitalea sp. CAU 1676]
MKRTMCVLLLLCLAHNSYCWGFYAHRKINELAIFLLPPEMMVLYKPNSAFISQHAVDPDKRRYILPAEGPRHYIDIDYYGTWPYEALPRNWDSAVKKYSQDTLLKYGIVPWWIQINMHRLTQAFREKDQARILKLSADLGHYIGDAHVPLHVSSNHNGQHTGQHGIHGFWESRIPELFAEKEWNLWIGKASYIEQPANFIWSRILESAAAADTVLRIEQALNNEFPTDQKFAFEDRNGIITRQYSAAYSRHYDQRLNKMVERRMRQSIFAVASCWYTAWVNAGQPDLRRLSNRQYTKADEKEFETLNLQWKSSAPPARSCD